MEYGVIYIRLIPKEESIKWIKYCYIYNSLPHPIQDVIKSVTTYINNKYNNSIIIPLGLDSEIGCIVDKEMVNIISNDLYNKYNELLNDISIKECVRLVYSVGNISNINTNSIHSLHNNDILIKVGRCLDNSNNIEIIQI